ncbi:hypothetical protein OIV83_005515 [Microbotryomycetes sp. JL201]|nr:hypothetical protein OIV83_005515 [Microbotryomycetes sp. JL201]
MPASRTSETSKKPSSARPPSSSDESDRHPDSNTDDEHTDHSGDDKDEEKRVGGRSSDKKREYASIHHDSDTDQSHDEPPPMHQRKSRKPPSVNPAPTSRPGLARTNGSRTWLWVIVGVLVLLLLTAGGFLIYKLVTKDSAEVPHRPNLTESTAVTDMAASLTVTGVRLDSSTSLPSSETLSPDSSGSTVTLNSSVHNATATATSNTIEPNETDISTMIASGHPRDSTDDVPNMPTRTNTKANAPTKTDMDADDKPSKTKAVSIATQAVQATWFSSDQGITTCLSKSFDHDYVVHISAELYGKLDRISKYCGKWVTVWNPETDQTRHLTVEGVCERCRKYELDLSARAFYELVGDADVGIAKNVQWWFTPKDEQPKPSIESFVPTAFQTGAQWSKETKQVEHEHAQKP